MIFKCEACGTPCIIDCYDIAPDVGPKICPLQGSTAIWKQVNGKPILNKMAKLRRKYKPKLFERIP